MIGNRIIGVIIIKDGLAVQSFGFKTFLPIGKPEITACYLDSWGIDEILLLDVSAPRHGARIDPNIVERVAKKILSPLTVAGGISSLEDVRLLMNSGADKVGLCSILASNPQLITEIAENFGSQAVVAILDVVRDGHGGLRAHRSALKEAFSESPSALAHLYQKLGAGELLIHMADRDGTGGGYDIEALNQISERCSLPIIAVGGYGAPAHLIDLFNRTSIRAAGIGNALNFTEHSILTLKASLRKQEIPVRIDLATNYLESEVDSLGRILKKEDSILSQLRFVVFKPEVI